MSDHEQESHSPPERHSPAANGWLVIVLVGLVAVLLFKTVTDSWRNRHDYTQRTVTPRGELASDETARVELFEKVSPSVVYVRMKSSAGQPTNGGRSSAQELGSGTGIVWDEDGHIVTNLHVVRDALLRQGAELEVQLGDLSSSTAPLVFTAEFVGAVSKHDIAVLKISAEPSLLVPITIG